MDKNRGSFEWGKTHQETMNGSPIERKSKKRRRKRNRKWRNEKKNEGKEKKKNKRKKKGKWEACGVDLLLLKGLYIE